ncbi:hypothetical protein Vretimale_17013 [Volvox reticuliferus]|uniref:Uncharacterized protein n=1 Tax=Volvox reticuliferus TaxID=1737510 RepID=A0A8J4CFK1_9CHLO|nr:hypothetical protein Vretifemale_7879 [Volvox reticuliferus]GIM13989.1 hypothetical protein Vretimale_17013 [Volvox reticuliferus]
MSKAISYTALQTGDGRRANQESQDFVPCDGVRYGEGRHAISSYGEPQAAFTSPMQHRSSGPGCQAQQQHPYLDPLIPQRAQHSDGGHSHYQGRPLGGSGQMLRQRKSLNDWDPMTPSYRSQGPELAMAVATAARDEYNGLGQRGSSTEGALAVSAGQGVWQGRGQELGTRPLGQMALVDTGHQPQNVEGVVFRSQQRPPALRDHRTVTTEPSLTRRPSRWDVPWHFEDVGKPVGQCRAPGTAPQLSLPWPGLYAQVEAATWGSLVPASALPAESSFPRPRVGKPNETRSTCMPAAVSPAGGERSVRCSPAPQPQALLPIQHYRWQQLQAGVYPEISCGVSLDAAERAPAVTSTAVAQLGEEMGSRTQQNRIDVKRMFGRGRQGARAAAGGDSAAPFGSNPYDSPENPHFTPNANGGGYPGGSGTAVRSTVADREPTPTPNLLYLESSCQPGVSHIAVEALTGPRSAAPELRSGTAVQSPNPNPSASPAGDLEGPVACAPPRLSSGAVTTAPSELPGIAIPAAAQPVEPVDNTDVFAGTLGPNGCDMGVGEAVGALSTDPFADANIIAGCADAAMETSGAGLADAPVVAAISSAGTGAHTDGCAADSALCVSAAASLAVRRRGSSGGSGGGASGASHSLRPDSSSQGRSSGRSRRPKSSSRSPSYGRHMKQAFPKTVFVAEVEDNLWAGGDGEQADHGGEQERHFSVPLGEKEVAAAIAVQHGFPKEDAASPEQAVAIWIDVPEASPPLPPPPPPPPPPGPQAQQQQQQPEGTAVLGLGHAACGTEGCTAANLMTSPSGRVSGGKAATATASQDHLHHLRFLQDDAWAQDVLQSLPPPMSARRTPDTGRGHKCRQDADDDTAASGAVLHRRRLNNPAAAAAAAAEAEGPEAVWRQVSRRQAKESPAPPVLVDYARPAINKPGAAEEQEEGKKEEEAEDLDDAHSPFQASDRLRRQRLREGPLAHVPFERHDANGGDVVRGRRRRRAVETPPERGGDLKMAEAIASATAGATGATGALAAEQDLDEGHAHECNRLDRPTQPAGKQVAMVTAVAKAALLSARSSSLEGDAAGGGRPVQGALSPRVLPLPCSSPAAIAGSLPHAAPFPSDDAQTGNAAGDGVAGPPAPAATFASAVEAVDVSLPPLVPTVSPENSSSDVRHAPIKHTVEIRGRTAERNPLTAKLGQLRTGGQKPGPCGGVQQPLDGSESAPERLVGDCQVGCDASTVEPLQLPDRQLTPLLPATDPVAQQQQQQQHHHHHDLDHHDQQQPQPQQPQQQVAAVGPPRGFLEAVTCLLGSAQAVAAMVELATVGMQDPNGVGGDSGGSHAGAGAATLGSNSTLAFISEDEAVADHSPPGAASLSSPDSVDEAEAAAAAGAVAERSPPEPDLRVSADDGDHGVPFQLVRYDAAGRNVGDQDRHLMQEDSPGKERRGRLATATATATAAAAATTTTMEAPGSCAPQAADSVLPGLPLRPRPGPSETSHLDRYQRCLMQQQQQQASLPLPLSFLPPPFSVSPRSLLELIRLQADVLLLEGDLDDPSLITAAYSAFNTLNLPLAAMVNMRRQHAAVAGTGLGKAGAGVRAGTANAATAANATAAVMGSGASSRAQLATEGGDDKRRNGDRRAGEAGPSELRNRGRGRPRAQKHDGTRPGDGPLPQTAPMHTSAPKAGRLAAEEAIGNGAVGAAKAAPVALLPEQSVAARQLAARARPPVPAVRPSQGVQTAPLHQRGAGRTQVTVPPPATRTINQAAVATAAAAPPVDGTGPEEVPQRPKRARRPTAAFVGAAAAAAAAQQRPTSAPVGSRGVPVRAKSVRIAAARASLKIVTAAAAHLRSMENDSDEMSSSGSSSGSDADDGDTAADSGPADALEVPSKRPRRSTGGRVVGGDEATAAGTAEGKVRRASATGTNVNTLAAAAAAAAAATSSPAAAAAAGVVGSSLALGIQAVTKAGMKPMQKLPSSGPPPLRSEELMLSPQQRRERVMLPGGPSYPPFRGGTLYDLCGAEFLGGPLYVGKRLPRGLSLYTASTLAVVRKHPLHQGQLSASQRCHQCHSNCLLAECEWCGRKTVCERCHQTHFPSFAYVELIHKCPRCRGCCNCRRCHVRGRQQVPRMSVTWETRQDMARHALRFITGTGNGTAGSGCSVAAAAAIGTTGAGDASNSHSSRGGALGCYLASERAELLAEGFCRLSEQRQRQQRSGTAEVDEDVEYVNLMNQRTLCDLCATSLPAMHRACASCRKEYCLSCCRELRQHCHQQQPKPSRGGSSSKGPAGGWASNPLHCPVPGCGQPTRLRTYLPGPMHCVLKKLDQLAAEEWGDRADAGGPPLTPSFWDPALVVVSEAALRHEQFGSEAAARGAAAAAQAIMEQVRKCMARRGAVHGSEAASAEATQGEEDDDNGEDEEDEEESDPLVAAGIPRYRAGQELAPGHVVAWGRYIMPQEDVRLASVRRNDGPNKTPRHIFTPSSADLRPSSPRFVSYALLFQARWRLHEPVVVRACEGSQPQIWTPEYFSRAVREGHAAAMSSGVGDGAGAGSRGGPGKGGGKGHKGGRPSVAVSGGEDGGIFEDSESGSGHSYPLNVIDCADKFRVVEDMEEAQFFKLYREPYDKTKQPQMLKLKDYPPAANFHTVLPRHFKDFVESLPLPFMTRPDEAPLNLATWMPPGAVPTDLGPKAYIAFGTPEECEEPVERDSVTKLHIDMSDAVNCLNHIRRKQQAAEANGHRKDGAGSGAGAGGGGSGGGGGGGGRGGARSSEARCGDELPVPPEYGGAGAVWDIWAPGHDTEELKRYLTAYKSEFVHCGEVIAQVEDPVFDQTFFLNRRHRDQLWEQHRVASWHFEQYEHEAVFIPAGCPHQVRNLTSCIKTAVDFVSPEAVDESLAIAARLRLMPRDPFADDYHPANDGHSDRLQGLLIMMSSAVENYRVLHPGTYRAPPPQQHNHLAPAAANGEGETKCKGHGAPPLEDLPPLSRAAGVGAAGPAAGAATRAAKRCRNEAGLESEAGEQRAAAVRKHVASSGDGGGGGGFRGSGGGSGGGGGGGVQSSPYGPCRVGARGGLSGSKGADVVVRRRCSSSRGETVAVGAAGGKRRQQQQQQWQRNEEGEGEEESGESDVAREVEIETEVESDGEEADSEEV